MITSFQSGKSYKIKQITQFLNFHYRISFYLEVFKHDLQRLKVETNSFNLSLPVDISIPPITTNPMYFFISEV